MGWAKHTLALECFLEKHPSLPSGGYSMTVADYFLTGLSCTWDKIQMPDSPLTPEGLCHHRYVDGRSQALEDDLVGLRHWRRKELQHVHLGFYEGLPTWTQGIDLGTLLGKAGVAGTQVQRSHEYGCSPVKKVLETRMLHSLRAMSLSSNLICAPKVWSLGPWFIQVRGTVLESKLPWPWESFLTCAVEDGLLWVCLVSQSREGRHKMLIQEAILLCGVMKYIFVCWGSLMG